MLTQELTGMGAVDWAGAWIDRLAPLRNNGLKNGKPWMWSQCRWLSRQVPANSSSSARSA